MMNTGCSHSCGHAWRWNPWTRAELGLSRLPPSAAGTLSPADYDAEEASCSAATATGMVTATAEGYRAACSRTLRTLLALVRGGGSADRSLVQLLDVPGKEMGSMGLMEALLYASRNCLRAARGEPGCWLGLATTLQPSPETHHQRACPETLPTTRHAPHHPPTIYPLLATHHV